MERVDDVEGLVEELGRMEYKGLCAVHDAPCGAGQQAVERLVAEAIFYGFSFV